MQQQQQQQQQLLAAFSQAAACRRQHLKTAVCTTYNKNFPIQGSWEK